MAAGDIAKGGAADRGGAGPAGRRREQAPQLRRIAAELDGSRAKPHAREGVRERRIREARERQVAVSVAGREKVETGVTHVEAARRVHVAPTTLSRWERWEAEDGNRPRRRGRKPAIPPARRRQRLREVIEALGPQTGVAPIRAEVPGLSQRVIARRLRSARRRALRRAPHRGYTTCWTRAGATWSMDHTKAAFPIDGRARWLLVIRDLESRKRLVALPCEREDAATVEQALVGLFERHGPPLVLRSDNGSAFIAGVMERHAATWRFAWLYSPPRTPQYNGASEAGVGWFKVHVDAQAGRAGHPGRWTSRDVGRARRVANATLRPFGYNGPSPDEAFAARRPIREPEREAFLRACSKLEAEERARRGLGPHEPLDARTRRSVARPAIRRALCRFGLLTIRRRRNRPPLSPF